MLTSLPRTIAGAFKAQYLLSAAATLMLAACSQSIERFASNPSDQDPVYTASVAKQQPAAYVPRRAARRIDANVASSEDAIVSKPLASAPLSKPSGGYNYTSAYRAPTYKQPQLQAQRVAPAPPTAKPAPMTTAERHQLAPVAPAPAAPARASLGGTITVGPGMTLYSIARSSGLRIKDLASANGLKPPYSVRQGQVLHVPAASASTAVAPAKEKTAATVPAETAAAPKDKLANISVAPKRGKAEHLAVAKPGAVAAPETHQVAQGETLYSLGRKFGVTAGAIASSNGIDARKPLKLGAQLKIPAGGAVVAKADTAKPANPPGQETITDKGAASTAVAEARNAPSKLPPVAAPQVEKPAAPATQTADAGSGAAPAPADATGMRWPVRGKVISGFGAKPNGLKNEGINIAVPEGTSVRAADAGVVAYAGNELKGYGNLVLIRHDGGMVTAYAHAKELFVKRGDTVKRGDVIAKAGQTGSVSSPQLHFEVRKGATALDPMTYLNSATASN